MITGNLMYGNAGMFRDITEVSSVKIIQNSDGVGGIYIQQIGYYEEYQIVNYTGDPIYIQKSNGSETVIPCTIHAAHDKRVEVYVREVNGVKNFTSLNQDITKCPHKKIVIPISALNEGPLFCSDVNILIYVKSFHSVAIHPNSSKYKEIEFANMMQSASNMNNTFPITMYANDPAGIYKRLHIVINGHICFVNVTNHRTDGASDVIGIRYNDAVHGDVIVKSTFKELSANGNIWTLGILTVSPIYELLKSHLNITLTNDSNGLITGIEHDRLVKQAVQSRDVKIQEQGELLKAADTQIKALNASIKTLEDLKYSDRYADIKMSEIHHATTKLHNQHSEDVRSALLEIEASRARVKEEYTKTLHTCLKTITILVPVCVTVYKAIATLKAKEG